MLADLSSFRIFAVRQFVVHIGGNDQKAMAFCQELIHWNGFGGQTTTVDQESAILAAEHRDQLIHHSAWHVRPLILGFLAQSGFVLFAVRKETILV